jgi:hypothetical protein
MNDAREHDLLPIEISYWEGLRAYWRAYWPTQLVGLGAGTSHVRPCVA